MTNEQVGPCSNCSHNCFMNQQSQRTECCPSFFKVMFGKQFSEALIVPPRFSRKLAHLVAKRTYIENSNGQKWDVILSNVNGSLAFTKGWREFCKDHDIQMGDIVVFRLIKESRFFAQIYGRSGCEKPYFSGTDVAHDMISEPNRNDLTELTSAIVPRQVAIHRQNHVDDHETNSLELTGNVACRENVNQRLTLANTETSLKGKHDHDYVVYLSNIKQSKKENDADKTSENQLQVAVKTEPCSEWLMDEGDTLPNREEALLLPVAMDVQPENVLQRQDDLNELQPPHLDSKLPRNMITTPRVNVEDPCYMVHRDGMTFKEPEREVLFDLSTFENPNDNTVAEVSKKPRFQ